MTSSQIKISIVTICRNAAAMISRTVQSVTDQDYANIEYIIIDGGSTDSTIERLEGFNRRIDKLISEPDDGIFDAMNKGVKNASGDFIMFLNAGDYLIHPGVITRIGRFLAQSEAEIDVLSARLVVYDPNGRSRIWVPRPATALSLYMGSLPHPSTFHSRKSFEENGLFDTSFRIAGDYEWFVRGLKNGLNFYTTEILTTVFIRDGISSSVEWKYKQEQEIEHLRTMYFSRPERARLSVGRFLRKNKLL